MNKCIFVGNLTRDPEYSTTGSGIALCRFSIAVSRNFKRDGEPDADFFNIVTWRGLAENCHKYLSKGTQGSPREKPYHSWQPAHGPRSGPKATAGYPSDRSPLRRCCGSTGRPGG